jgi:eukaryotic-like serine/threonine-protein kinase
MDGETVFAHSQGSSVEDSATVFASPSSLPPDDEATRFVLPPSKTSGHSPDTTGLPASAGGRPAKARGPLEVGQRFGARYHILRQLGIGGMGAVYQAWDAELGVAVALKVIRPEVTRDPVAAQDIERRFKQELLLARQVTHKNVVRIHDLGEIDGIKYITMTYIEGQDLASVLRNERLTVPKVMSLARQVAAGLQAAHEAGVVHRDLKPANVMLEGEHAIIMDFGIARSTSRGGAPAPRPAPAPSGSTGGAALNVGADAEMTRIAETLVGEVIGTIEYMAPEQARGEHVDQRADVYAFGLIVYDLLSGKRRSEHAVSAVGELQKRLAQPPPSIRTILPDIPLPLDQLITKCTEPDAANRYQTTTELVAAIELLDDNGKLRPIKRAIRLPYAIATAAVLLALSGYIWWAMRPPVTHDPVSVVIADFANKTGDSALDGTLETVVRRALEGASFISAYDRNATAALGVSPPERLDEAAARKLAVNQGLGIVLAGSIDPQGGGYRVSVRVTRAITGEEITREERAAPGKEMVLETVTRLMSDVRSALGDEASESDSLFANNTISSASLETVKLYTAARQAASNGKHNEAFQIASQAVTLDPKYGLGWGLMATASLNLGKRQDAEKYIKEALSHVESMTEREKYAIRGLFFRVTGDYQQCLKEYGLLIAQYPADVVGHNQVAVCSSLLRDMRTAVAEMRRAVEILPNRTLFRTNLALYLNYGGEFQAAEKEARAIKATATKAALAVAFAQLGQSQWREATETYEKLKEIDTLGASLAATGLADLARVEGRYSDAARMFEQGAAADLASKNPDRAAAKFAALADVELQRGRKAAAIAAAEKALLNSNDVKIRFLAARLFVEAGETDKARSLLKELATRREVEPQAYAKIVEGEIALKTKQPRDAIKLLTEANALLDTWIGHFDLGRAYLDDRGFTQADSEFDLCIKRRGEALSLFVDDEPSYGYLPRVHYYLGLAREGMGAGGAEQFKTYLSIRGNSTEDSLVKDAKSRAAR